jgi:hypothetical protein
LRLKEKIVNVKMRGRYLICVLKTAVTLQQSVSIFASQTKFVGQKASFEVGGGKIGRCVNVPHLELLYRHPIFKYPDIK